MPSLGRKASLSPLSSRQPAGSEVGRDPVQGATSSQASPESRGTKLDPREQVTGDKAGIEGPTKQARGKRRVW